MSARDPFERRPIEEGCRVEMRDAVGSCGTGVVSKPFDGWAMVRVEGAPSDPRRRPQMWFVEQLVRID